MESNYLNKMQSSPQSKRWVRLKKRYDLPSGKIFYKGDMVELAKEPELLAEVKRGSTRLNKRTNKSNASR